jgi:hypothetical protein
LDEEFAMNIALGYPNARSVAYAVKRELDGQGPPQITARPWNRHDPDNTFWWLVPSSDWPAYKHGKIFFSPDRAPRDCLFCGIHVEKGLDPSIAAAYPSGGGKRMIMGDDWTWHEFLRDLGSDNLSSAIERASEESGGPITIRLEAGFVEDPGSFDPQANRPKWDIVVCETFDDSLLVETSETPSNLLDKVSDSQSLEELASSISEIPSPEWVWLDVFLGNVFARIPEVSDLDTWSAGQLWNKALSMWERWFK